MIITAERENKDIQTLAKKLSATDWMDKDVLIINVDPDYSSKLTQQLNHLLSVENDYELYPVQNLSLPMEDWKVWDDNDAQYVPYDSYLLSWLRIHYNITQKYLFVTARIDDGKAHKRIMKGISSKVESENYKFISLYTELNSLFKPDIQVGEFVDKQFFEWERPKTFK